MLIFLLSLVDERHRSTVERIYNKYHENMYKLAKSIFSALPDADDCALDAVHNAFVTALEHYDRINFEESDQKIAAYAYAILTHQCYDQLKKRLSRSVSPKESEIIINNTPDDDFISMLCLKEEHKRVQQLVEQMDDKYSVPLQMMYAHNLSAKQIAQILGIKESTVYTRISRAKEWLLEKLKEEKL